MSREENIRAILECNFYGFKEEIIETAVKMILETDSANDIDIVSKSDDDPSHPFADDVLMG